MLLYPMLLHLNPILFQRLHLLHLLLNPMLFQTMLFPYLLHLLYPILNMKLLYLKLPLKQKLHFKKDRYYSII